MQCVIEIGDPRVIAIHSQKILGKVIGAHRQKVDSTTNFLDLINRSGHLNHGSHWRPLYGVALFLSQLVKGAINQLQRAVQLWDIANHGQHNAQIIDPLTGTQQSANLHQKNLRMV